MTHHSVHCLLHGQLGISLNPAQAEPFCLDSFFIKAGAITRVDFYLIHACVFFAYIFKKSDTICIVDIDTIVDMGTVVDMGMVVDMGTDTICVVDIDTVVHIGTVIDIGTDTMCR